MGNDDDVFVGIMVFFHKERHLRQAARQAAHDTAQQIGKGVAGHVDGNTDGNKKRAERGPQDAGQFCAHAHDGA